jgi:hypothetical protein
MMAYFSSLMFRPLKKSSVLPRSLGIADRLHYRNGSWNGGMKITLGRLFLPSGSLLSMHKRSLHHEIVRASYPSLVWKSRLGSVSSLSENHFSQHFHGFIGIKYFRCMVQRNVYKTVGSAKLSTSAAPTATNSTKSSTGDTPKSEKGKSSEGNVFLDNIGTIFLLFIASLIAWMVRGYYNGVRRNTVREKQIESLAHADPIELDDLRVANSPEFNLVTFQYIRRFILDQKRDTQGALESNHDPVDGHSDMFADDNSSSSTVTMVYPEFVSLVRTAMAQMKGEAFTIQLGHILDRVVVAALETQRKSRKATEGTGSSDTSRDHASDSNTDRSANILEAAPMPLEFWLTVLTLAMSGTPFERIQALHSLFCSSSDNSVGGSPTISIDQVVQLVGYLQDTCQLVPDAQVVMTSHKYPLQEYVVANPEQLVDRQQWENTEGTDGRDLSNCASNITATMLTEILSSRSVCAWGECYRYKAK